VSAAVVSAAVVSAGAASTGAVGSVATSSFLAPHATIATAKAATINIANNFFIVYRFFKNHANITGIGYLKGGYPSKKFIFS
jgi:hypothetical protein